MNNTKNSNEYQMKELEILAKVGQVAKLLAKISMYTKITYASLVSEDSLLHAQFKKVCPDTPVEPAGTENYSVQTRRTDGELISVTKDIKNLNEALSVFRRHQNSYAGFSDTRFIQLTQFTQLS